MTLNSLGSLLVGGDGVLHVILQQRHLAELLVRPLVLVQLQRAEQRLARPAVLLQVLIAQAWRRTRPHRIHEQTNSKVSNE